MNTRSDLIAKPLWTRWLRDFNWPRFRTLTFEI